MSQSYGSQGSWDGRDITRELAAVNRYPKRFHAIDLGSSQAGVYLTESAHFGNVCLSYRSEMRHGLVEVYAVSAIDVPVGLLFRSPLQLHVDPNYMLFARRRLDPIEDVIKSPAQAERRFLVSDLAVHSHNSGVLLVTRSSDDPVIAMLDK